MKRIGLFFFALLLAGCSSEEQAKNELEDYVKFIAVNYTALNEAIIYQPENTSYRSFVVYSETTIPPDLLLPGEPGYESPKVPDVGKNSSKPDNGGIDYAGVYRAQQREREEGLQLARSGALRSLVTENLKEKFCSARLGDLMKRTNIDQVVFILDDRDSIQIKFTCN